MALDVAQLVALLREIESEDPLDFGDLPIAEDDARRLIASHLVDLGRHLDDSLGSSAEAAAQKQTILLAIAARCLLENFVLHARELAADRAGVRAQADALIRRLTRPE